jgi:hypothetical protein
MTSTSRAGQIAALSERVNTLGGRARGMPLAAADWNAVVATLSAILKIDQEQDSDTGARLDEAYARIDHQHLGQVTLAWLDPDLQSQVAGGGESVPTRQVIAVMQKTVDGLQTQVAELKALVEKQQAALDRASAAAIDHTRALQAFEGRFAGIEDLRTAVNSIVREQVGIKKSVKMVLDLRGQLTDAAGAAIDISGLAAKVTELLALRDNLTGIDGKPLRLKDLQLQVRELSTKVSQGGAGGGDITIRFNAFAADLQTRLSKESEVQIGTLRTEMGAAQAGLIADVGTRIEKGVTTSRLAAIGATTDLVKSTETRLSTNFANELAATRTTLTTTMRQRAGEAVAESMAGVDARIDSKIETRATGLKTLLAGEIQTSLDTRLTQGLADATGRLDGKFAVVESRLNATALAIPQQVQQRVATVEAGLLTRIDSQLSTRTAVLQQSLTTLVDQQVRTVVTTGLADVRTAASQTVAERLGDLDARISASVKSATRTLPDQVGAALDTRLAQANIAGQIDAAKNAVTLQLRSEIDASAANVQRANGAALSSAVVNLRTELVAPAPTGTVVMGGRPNFAVNRFQPG